jgi:predicted transcriptional regulator
MMSGVAPQNILLDLTAKIVSAHVACNAITADALPLLIREVYSSLAEAYIDVRPEPAAERPEPAVNPKKSVFPGYIICLEDGQKLKLLRRHLRTRYKMTPEQYCERWGLPPNYPMVAPNYAETRSAMAKSFGLGRKPAAAAGGAAEEAASVVEGPGAERSEPDARSAKAPRMRKGVRVAPSDGKRRASRQGHSPDA